MSTPSAGNRSHRTPEGCLFMMRKEMSCAVLPASGGGPAFGRPASAPPVGPPSVSVPPGRPASVVSPAIGGRPGRTLLAARGEDRDLLALDRRPPRAQQGVIVVRHDPRKPQRQRPIPAKAFEMQVGPVP